MTSGRGGKAGDIAAATNIVDYVPANCVVAEILVAVRDCQECGRRRSAVNNIGKGIIGDRLARTLAIDAVRIVPSLNIGAV